MKQVPTQAARNLAAAANAGGVVGYMAQFANAYPLPDGNPSTPCTTFATCTANYTASFPGKSVLDSTSGRVDYSINQRMTLFGRYSHSPSSLVADNSADTQPVLTTATMSIRRAGPGPSATRMSNDLRFNFTHTTLVKVVNPLTFTGQLELDFPHRLRPACVELSSNPGTMSIQIRGLPTDGMHPGAGQCQQRQ